MIKVTQQDRLYEAQVAITPTVWFKNPAEAQAFVDRLTGSDDWDAYRYWVATVEVEPTLRPDKYSTAGKTVDRVGSMHLNRAGLNDRTVIHELAHSITIPQGSTGHDPLFARVFLELVYRFMGGEAWATLRRSFAAHDVCFDDRCQEVCSCG